MPGPIFVVREIITTFINIYVGVLIDEPSDVKYSRSAGAVTERRLHVLDGVSRGLLMMKSLLPECN